MSTTLLARVLRRLPPAITRQSLLSCAVLGLLATVYGQTLAPSITWANSGADSGDLVTAAAVLGVAHPTGYPTYLLLARAFQQLPVGDLAFRTNLLSLSAALAAAWLTARVVATLCTGSAWAPWSAAAAALALGFSPVFWSQAVIAEVHSLNALFASALVLFALEEAHPQTSLWPARLRGLTAGLALGNHVTIVGLVLAWLVAAVGYSPRGGRLPAAMRRLAWAAAGALVYLCLPLRAAAEPAISWGGANSLPCFWWVVTGGPYHDLAFGLPPDLLGQRAAAWATLLLLQFGPLGVLLGFGGLIYSAALRAEQRLGSAFVFAAYSLFALLYDTADSHAYLLPAYVLFAVWFGCGCHDMAQRFGRPVAAFCALSVCVASIAAQAVATAPKVDASQDVRALTFATAVLAAAPERAVILTTTDKDSFALWYAHFALRHRPDAAIVVEPLLDFPWYRANLLVTYPGIRIPNPGTAGWAVVLMGANGGRAVCAIKHAEPAWLSCRSGGAAERLGEGSSFENE